MGLNAFNRNYDGDNDNKDDDNAEDLYFCLFYMMHKLNCSIHLGWEFDTGNRPV